MPMILPSMDLVVMSEMDHDEKCELARMASLLEAFGSWEEFNKLAPSAKSILLREIGFDAPLSECKCARRRRNRDDFIRLWTAAGAAKNYNKNAWKSVESQLIDIGEI